MGLMHTAVYLPLPSLNAPVHLPGRYELILCPHADADADADAPHFTFRAAGCVHMSLSSCAVGCGCAYCGPCMLKEISFVTDAAHALVGGDSHMVHASDMAGCELHLRAAHSGRVIVCSAYVCVKPSDVHLVYSRQLCVTAMCNNHVHSVQDGPKHGHGSTAGAGESKKKSS